MGIATWYKAEDVAERYLDDTTSFHETGESESVQEAILETTQTENEFKQIEMETAAAEEAMSEAEDVVSDMEDSLEGRITEDDGTEVKTESVGLSGTAAQLAAIRLRRAMPGATRIIPKMENFSSRADQRDNTRYVIEGVRDSLRKAWEWIKEQFRKAWAKLKDWYIKIFSASKRLAARAEKIRDKVDGGGGTTPENKKFRFTQVATLHIGGNLKEPSEFIESLELVSKIVEETHDIPTERMIDDLEDNLETLTKARASRSGSDKDKILVRGSKDFGNKIVNIGIDLQSEFKSVMDLCKHELDDKSKKALGINNKDGSFAKYIIARGSDELPGGKRLVTIYGVSKDAGNNEEFVENILRKNRVTFANAKDKPKQIASDAEATTLNSAQISDIANIVAESASTIFDYEKKWQRVDKKQDIILKKIDELVKDQLDEIEDDNSKTSKDERAVRTMASDVTGYIKRMCAIQSTVSSYAMNVYSAALNYCEGSLSNHKK